MQEKPMNRALKLILPIGLISFAIVVSISLWIVFSLQQAILLERQANEVQSSVDDLYQYIQESESSQRGYLLTRQDEYLTEYMSTVQKMPDLVESLKDKIHSTDPNENYVPKLEELISEKLDDLKNPLTSASQGQELMSDIRSVLDKIDHQAKREAVRHERFLNRYAPLLIATIIVGSLITLALVILFAYVSRQEIRRRAKNEKDLQQAQEAALVASKMKSKFLATVSHEIRTPLNGIIGMSDIIRSRLKEPEHRRFIEIIHSSGNALLKIVNDILDFSKVEAGKMEFEYSEFSALDVVQSSAELFSAKAREKNLSILTYVDPEMPAVLLGDASRIGQVLRNLISNAIKFTHSGGVLIKARHRLQAGKKVTVRFEVQDTGIGVSAENQRLLFQAFNQVHSEGQSHQDGTGLGLSICKGIVENMNGRIEIESSEKQGSLFWFEVQLKAGSDVKLADSFKIKERGQRLLCVGKNVLLDQIVAMYTSEMVLNARSEEAFPDDWWNDYDSVLINMEDFSDQELKQNLFNENAKGKTVVLIAKDQFKDQFDDISLLNSPTLPFIFLRNPFTREQFFAALNGERAQDEVPLETDIEIKNSDDGPLILLVEDNPTNQLVAQTLLEQLGCRVHVVANGAEAIEALERVSYSLVFMDCQMPVKDGFEATRDIRRREGSLGMHTPIVAMTANAMESDREKCLLSGMDDFISKPLKYMDLSNILNATLEKKQNSAVDWTVLSELAKNTNPVVVKRLIQSFLTTLPQTLGHIEKAITEENGKELGRWAHQLKASSASLGALELSDLCHQLENESEGTQSVQPVKTIAKQLLSKGNEVLSVFKEQNYYL